MAPIALTDTQKQILRDTAGAPEAPGPKLVFARYRKKVLVRAGETRWETPEAIDELLALEAAGLVRRVEGDAIFVRPKSNLVTGFLVNPKEFAFFELTDEGKSAAGA
jgi:hypothetical protein